ncbi:hypothetical protein D3C73_879560 [compost metagenome]
MEQGAEVDRHANTDKKQPEQQAFERLNITFQCMTVFGARQHHPGKEGAHRHRQPGHFQQDAKAKHQEQRHGAKDFAHAGAGDKVQQWPGHIAAEQHHNHQRADDLGRRQGEGR